MGTRCIKRLSLLLLQDTLPMKDICMVNNITPLLSANLHVESMGHYGQDRQIKLNSPSEQFHLLQGTFNSPNYQPQTCKFSKCWRKPVITLDVTSNSCTPITQNKARVLSKNMMKNS